MAVADGITWYDILGVSAGSDGDTIRDAYAQRIWQLRPELLSGVPSPVVSAAGRARTAVEAAWQVLSDPGRRQRYDRESGVQRGGRLRGSAAFGGFPGSLVSGLEPDYSPREAGAVLEALSVWTAPSPARPQRRLTIPDLRGLFFRPCRDLVTMAGLRLAVVRVTPDPMPVEGLVTGQSPDPGSQVRRGSTLTVQVWHPARHK
jgi:curved DNA-binding protein CbpA